MAQPSKNGNTFPRKEVCIGGYGFVLHGVRDADPYFNGLSDDFEPEFVDLCRRLIPEDAVCLDLGANIGVKTLLLSRLVPFGRVVAVEPAPTVAECLTLNVSANGATNVTVAKTAIGATSGTVRFVDESAYGHISEDGVEVSVTTLPRLVEALKLDRIDFIKIDVEGYEFPY